MSGPVTPPRRAARPLGCPAARERRRRCRFAGIGCGRMRPRRFATAVTLIALAICSSASANSGATAVFFKNGHAFCAAYNWTSAGGFVGCSARIRGSWQSVLLLGTGPAIRVSGHQKARRPASRYQSLRTHWRGGPFLCTVAPDGVICLSSVSGHGFGISGQGITTR